MKNLALNISLASLILLGGCSLTESLFPSNETDSYSSSANLPILGTTNFEPIEISDGSDTGTFVGQKVVSFRQELSQLQESIKTNNEELQKIRASVTSNALAYHRNVGAMEAKLQVGTTPGNPNMYQALQNAQTNIQTMTMNMDAMNQLVARVTSDAAMTEYLLDSIRAAYSVSGAVDEDHRQLRILENETNQTSILMNSLLSEASTDVSRQQQYVDTARNTMMNLNEAIKVGSYGVANAPLTSSAVRPVNNYNSPLLVGRPSPVATGKPLFTAKFHKGNVDYKNGLSTAVSNALSAKPNVMFNVVAVSPMNGNSSAQNTAQRKATEIFQEMINMGVGADKISISSRASAEADGAEVQIFVR